MDHHCPWISNCVGFNNYKFFSLLLFYASCSMAVIIGCMTTRVINIFQPLVSYEQLFLRDLPILISIISCAILFGVLSSFFGFHAHLTLSGVTTIENHERNNTDDPDIRHRHIVAWHKWNRGSYGNWCHVYGKFPLWFLPVMPRWDENGTYAWESRKGTMYEDDELVKRLHDGIEPPTTTTSPTGTTSAGVTSAPTSNGKATGEGHHGGDQHSDGQSPGGLHGAGSDDEHDDGGDSSPVEEEATETTAVIGKKGKKAVPPKKSTSRSGRRAAPDDSPELIVADEP